MNQKDISHIISAVQPDVVIHAAAVRDVLFCQSHPLFTENLNLGATAFIPKIRQYRFHTIFISAAEVYSGNTGMFFTEDIIPQPSNVYGMTKIRAEDILRESWPSWTILRLGALYGLNNGARASFIDRWMQSLVRKERMKLVADRFFTPLYVEDVPQIVRFAIETYKDNAVYHIAGPDRVSPYSFGLRLAKHFGYDENLVQPDTMEHHPDEKILGKDVSLGSLRLTKDFGLTPRSVTSAFKLLESRLNTGWTDERELVVES
jgi:dTDP-4-dehydrorhamnose reductase